MPMRPFIFPIATQALALFPLNELELNQYLDIRLLTRYIPLAAIYTPVPVSATEAPTARQNLLKRIL